MNEQESLARLIDNEGFDSSQSGDMIASSLKMALGGVDPRYYNKITNEVNSDETISSDKTLSNNNFNAENVLLKLFGVYDSLIGLFQNIGINNEISEELTQNIWAVEKCITEIGGQVDHFIPEDFVSGLVAPDMVTNAMKVIDTTRKCYKLGEIKNDQISKDGNVIYIDFHGISLDKTNYVAKGTIQAKKGWVGNEAIDYIYKIGGGKMTVKSYVDGKWMNQSSNYDIHWELEESDIAELLDEEVEPLPSANISSSIANEFKKAIKEETSNS